jgi:hypothetical protein
MTISVGTGEGGSSGKGEAGGVRSSAAACVDEGSELCNSYRNDIRATNGSA